MTIEQIKTQLGVVSLPFEQQVDIKTGEELPYKQCWLAGRMRITISDELFTKIKLNKEIDTLALSLPKEVIPSDVNKDVYYKCNIYECLDCL